MTSRAACGAGVLLLAGDQLAVACRVRGESAVHDEVRAGQLAGFVLDVEWLDRPADIGVNNPVHVLPATTSWPSEVRALISTQVAWQITAVSRPASTRSAIRLCTRSSV
jgi:hypothetical protein